MATGIQGYLTSYFEFYLTQPWDFLALMVAIYILYKSISTKMTVFSFLKGGAIALTLNHYLAVYMHINEVVALLLTVGLLPILEWLLDLSLEKMGVKHKEKELPILYGGHTGNEYFQYPGSL